MNRNLRIMFSALLVVLWMLVIFAFSHQANSNEMTKPVLGPFNIFVRKCAHMTEYAILFLLSLNFCRQFAVRWQPGAKVLPSFFGGLQLERPKRVAEMVCTFISPIAIAFLYACSDEWHQSFVPGRSAAFSDVLVDSTGILIAAVLIALSTFRKR